MAIANSDGSVIITTKLDFTPVSKALNALKSKFASLKEQRSAIQELTTAIKDQQFVIKQLEIEYAMMIARGQGNTAQAEALKTRLTALKLELTQLRGAASAMGAETAAAFTTASAGLKEFGKRIAGIVKSALIFSVLYRVMQSVVKLFKNILMSDEEFRQDWEELKAAFYTAAYPIVNLIVPAIKWIVHQVRDWAVSIGRIAAALQGMSYSELVDQAKASKEAADNYADMEKNSKKTADNVKKQLASFDDIQILSSGNDEEQQGAGFAGFEGLKEYDASDAKSILGNVMSFIGGALAAVGIILLFKGQIGWGIGFIVGGAAVWAIKEIWGEDYDPSSISQTLNNIMETLSVSLAAVGIMLLLKGQIGWGIGFLIGGAAFWAISEIWGEDDDLSNVSTVVNNIMGTLGVSLAAIGIILLTKGITGWGIGFLVGGASFWAISEIWGEEDDLSDTSVLVENIMQTIGVSLAAVGLILLSKGIIGWGIGFIVAGAAIWAIEEFASGEFSEEPIVNTLVKIMGIAGTVLAALGIILLVFGQIIWGLALLAAGAYLLAEAFALNDEAVVEAIRGPIGAIMAIVGAALLVLGIILVCTGVIPLGIALIAAGAASLVTVTALNWDAIVEWVKGAWDAVKRFWNQYIAPVFTAEWWINLGKTCINGLIAGFEGGINGIIGAFETMINWVVDGLNKISFDIPDWLGGGSFGINLPRADFGRVSIPRLAQGAVIPPNREFLAVLGDQRQGVNIETPLATMVEAFQVALDSRGGYNSGNMEVVLEIDGREFGRAVVEQGNRESRRIGTRLVIV